MTTTCACPTASDQTIGMASEPEGDPDVQSLRSPSRQTDQTNRHDEDRLPDERRRLEREQREWPEGDGEQWRVAVERGFVGPDGLVVERQAGVETRAGVVVRTDVRERIHRQVEDRVVDPDERPEDRGTDQDRADPAARGSLRDRGMPAILPTAVPHRTPPKGTRDRPFVPVGGARTRCYAAPAVRTPLLLYGLALAVRAVAHLALPGPGLPRFVLLRRRRPIARRRPRLQRRLHLDLRRGRRRDPGRPGPADPVERPLDAAGVDRPGAVHRGLRRRRPGPRRSRSRLIGSIAAPLTWAIARDAGCPLGRRDRRRRPRRRSRAGRRLHGPAGQLLALPAAGLGAAVAGGARAAGHPAASFVAGGPARRSRDARPQRRRPRPGWRLGLVFVWDRWRALAVAAGAGPAIPFAAAVGCVALFLLVDGARGGPASWPSSGRSRRSTRVGQGPVHPRHRRVEQHHDAGHPRAPPRPGARARSSTSRIGGLVAAVGDLHRDPRRRVRPRPVHGHRRLGAGAARSTSGRSSLYAGAPVRVLGPRLRRPRPGRDVHPLGRSRLAPVRLHPGARGDRGRRRLGRPAPAGVGRRGAPRRVFVGAIGRLRGRRGRARRPARSTRTLGRPTRPASAGGRRRARRGRRRRPTTGSCRSTPPARSTGPAAAASSSSTTRSRRSRTSRAPTTSAGWSSSAATSSPRARAGPRRRRPPGLDRAAAFDPGRRPADPRSRSTRSARRRRHRCGRPVTPPRGRCCRRCSSSPSRSWSRGRRSPPQIVFPKPEDTAYYVGVARNLVEGRGLVSDALWSYQTPPLVFPRPAFEVWLPLPTFLAAIPMAHPRHDVRRRPGRRRS